MDSSLGNSSIHSLLFFLFPLNKTWMKRTQMAPLFPFSCMIIGANSFFSMDEIMLANYDKCHQVYCTFGLVWIGSHI